MSESAIRRPHLLSVDNIMEASNNKANWLQSVATHKVVAVTYNFVALIWVAFWFCLAVITSCQRSKLALVYQTASRIPVGKSLLNLVQEDSQKNP
jgi:hypothetical protein